MKKSKIIILLTTFAVLSTILFTTCKKEEPELFGSINGIVTISGTTDALQGVTIVLTPTGKTLTTGSDGKFEYKDLEAKEYTLSATKDGYQSNTKTVTVSIGEDTKADIILTADILTPTISTANPVILLSGEATVDGIISDIGNGNIIAHGHIWSTSPAPTIALDTKIDYGQRSENGAYTSTLTELNENTKYYVRAYATNGFGTAYSNEVSFTTGLVEKILLALPAAASNWQMGKKYEIKWTDNLDENVKIELYRNGVLHNIVDNSTLSDGSYDWQIPLNYEESSDYQISIISSIDLKIRGESDVFTISNYTEPLIDTRDDQTYQIVQIFDQIWMQENLNYYSQYSYYYDNDSAQYSETYGRLYYSSVRQNVCPDGWHLPSNNEWETLRNNLGGEPNAGGHMKEASTGHWVHPNTSADNSSGFTALPAGLCAPNDYSAGLGTTTFFWSNSSNGEVVYIYQLSFDNSFFLWTETNEQAGFSIRCIKN